MSVETDWKSISPKIPPVAYLLKHIYPEKWIRIHSLPNSKRYPECKSEIATMNHRNISLIKYLSGKHDKLYIFGSKYPKNDLARKSFKYLKRLTKKLSLFNFPPVTECDGYEIPKLEIYSGLFHTSKLKKLLKYTSVELLSNITIANFDSNFLYHPYDGGFDLIINDNEIIGDIKLKFGDWLPDQ
ncbi:MAG: hypothetical protein GY756_21095 [bacterium]|nr:hypothetical protein [bacterium]